MLGKARSSMRRDGSWEQPTDGSPAGVTGPVPIIIVLPQHRLPKFLPATVLPATVRPKIGRRVVHVCENMAQAVRLCAEEQGLEGEFIVVDGTPRFGIGTNFSTHSAAQATCRVGPAL